MNPTVSRFLKEPLLHFLILGLLLFALFAWVNRGAMYAPSDIVVDDDLLQSIKTKYQTAWQRELTGEELRGLVKNWVQEEILFREGVAMGLDQDDEVVRQRVIQKMEFITEDTTDTTPDEAELQAWLDANPEDYTTSPVYSFKHIYIELLPDQEELRQLLNEMYQKLLSGDEIDSDPSLLPAAMQDVDEGEIVRIFGREFASAIANLELHTWSQPVRSGFGYHFVYLESRQAGRLAHLAEVRQWVAMDYLEEQKKKRKEAMFEALSDRYNIIYATQALAPDSASQDAVPPEVNQ